MAARLLRLVFALSLLSWFPQLVSASGEDPDLPEHIYLPLILQSANATSGNTPVTTCQVLWQSPADGAFLPAGSAFIMHWSIQNTSPAAWRSDQAVIRFVSGDRLQTAETYDLPNTVEPGSTIIVSLNLHAPSVPGTFVSNWAIVADETTFCSFYARLRVLQ